MAAGSPDPGDLPADLARRAGELFEAAAEGGDVTAVDEFCAAHPDHAATIRARWSRARSLCEDLEQRHLDAQPPTRIGPYRVVGKLGEGGMGAVFLAEEDGSLRRQLAVKLIKRGIDGAAAQARFALERQALAVMDHPGIAKVFTAGTTADGRPYFAMELVRGQPLTGHCDSRRLPVAERLRLFLSVCDAVQHAHYRGVIHRDLKPSNILVADQDGGTAMVKVIDFGVARADFAAVDEGSEPGLLGTPAYMSPEQTGVSGHPVDSRSDVYSLGVVLYELLCGELPLDPDLLRGLGPFEVRRQIVEGRPQAPSERLATGAPARTTMVAASRRSVAGKLLRQLRSELDWVVMKALAKRPDDRYRTPADLAADVQRYLDGLPVAAGPASLRRRLRGLARRHRRAVVAAAVAVSLAAAALAVGWLVAEQGRRAAADREARRQRVAALRLELQRARDGAVPLRVSLEHVPEFQRWLDAAVELEGRLQAARGELQALLVDLDGDDADGALRRELEALLREHDEFVYAPDGFVAQVQVKLELAKTVEHESITAASAAWQRLAAELADDPRFAGTPVAPQLGLWPAGRDPVAGLPEFAVLGTGSLPERDAGGVLRPDPDRAIVLVLLPAGTFRLGADPDRDPAAEADEQPVRSVTLAPFFIGKFEVTQAQWRRLGFGDEPSRHRAGMDDFAGHAIDRSHPVEWVSWFDANAALARFGLELPTEAQWEYAARAGTTSPWACDAAAGGLAAVANLADRDAASYPGVPPDYALEPWRDGWPLHAPVGSFAANAFGLHDTVGNVWEWCRDAYGSYAEPVRPGDGLRLLATDDTVRVGRGGSFEVRAAAARVSYRNRTAGHRRGHSLGLRAARVLRR